MRKTIIRAIYFGFLLVLLWATYRNFLNIIRTNTPIEEKVLLNETKENTAIDYGYDEVIGKLRSLQEDMALIKHALTAPYSNTTIMLAKDNLMKINVFEKSATRFVSEPNWSISEEIGYDVRMQKNVKAQEIINSTVIIPYKDDGYDVIFCGQFNENMHWNDRCVINVYDDDVLVYVTEADYDDGTILSYKQAFVDKGKWYTSARKVEYSINGYDVANGETWVYEYSLDIKRQFDLENVASENIITVDRLRLGERLLEYYSGRTYLGKYNDDTGEALFVSFLDDNTVKTLYKGRIIDGQFHDESGDAWEIAKELTTGNYYYYSGVFNNGKRPDHKMNQKPLTTEQIFQILEENGIKLEIKWQ